MGLFDRLKKPRQPDVAAQVEAALDEVAAKLGPFPDTFSYQFEPELQCATPRPIPPSFKQGGHAKNFRSGMIALFLFGVLSLFFSCLSWTERLSYYFLPLGYLDWLGLFLLGVGVIILVARKIVGGQDNWVRDGNLMVVRVLDSGIYRFNNGQVDMLGAYARADYRDPETGAIERIEFQQILGGGTRSASQMAVALKPGNLATAIYRGKPKDARLYGFMRLNPEVNFVTKNGAAYDNSFSPVAVVCIVMGVFALLGMLMFVGDMDSFWPIDEPDKAIGIAAGIGALIFAPLFPVIGKLSRSKIGVGIVWQWIAGMGLGAFIGITLPIGLNAALDHSEPTYRDVAIVNYWQTTYNGIIRNYSVEWRELTGTKTKKYPAPVELMERFSATDAGVIAVRKGFFGWPWISEIIPVEIDEEDQPSAAEPLVKTLEYEDEVGKKYKKYFRLGIQVSADKTIDPSPALCKVAWDNATKGSKKGNDE